MIGNAAGGYQKEIDVFIQSNTSNLFQAFLQTYDKEDITLTSDVNIDDRIINVSAGHGITAGDSLIIYTDDYHHQFAVVSVSVNAITMEAPFYFPFPVANTTIIRGKTDVNVLGSLGSPVIFKFGLPGINQLPIDVNKGIILMGHTADQDDSKYGGIAALTNGFLIRKENAVKFNLGIYRSNRDYKLNNGEVVPTDKAPAGEFGTEIRFKIQGQENFDQVIRFQYGDYLTGYVQDDLRSLLFKKVSLIGSYTSGE